MSARWKKGHEPADTDAAALLDRAGHGFELVLFVLIAVGVWTIVGMLL